MASRCVEGWINVAANGWWSGSLRKGVQGGSRGFENWRRGPHEGKMVRASLWGIEHKETVVARKVGMRSLVAARGKSRSR